jgi:predicted secreted protein
MGDTARTYKSSLTSFSGSLDVFWDETDTNGQGALTIGSEVTLNVYPEGDTAGDTYYTGAAIVTGVSRSASFDGLVEASVSVQGTGALTSTTV